MKFLLTIIVISTTVLFTSTGFGQVKPAILKIRFDKPDLQASSVRIENGKIPTRRVVLDSTTTRSDSAGITTYSFALRKAGLKNILFFKDSTTFTSRDFFLRPGDLIYCTEKGGEFTFEGEGSSVKLNRFLQQIGVVGEDTLRQKPLMRKVADDLYANFMRDIADEKWHLYQTTQDTTDSTQNILVKAALEAQQYQRVQHFLRTKDWTDEMFARIKTRFTGPNQFVMPNFDNPYRPPFRIVQHEDAILCRDYLFSLTSHLGGNIYFPNQKTNLSEKIVEFYDAVDRELSRLPQTREALLSSVLRGNWFNDSGSQGLLERFERDFPNSKHLKEVHYANWSMQKAKAGASIPPIPLLKSDSTQTTLGFPKGSPTFVLIWNTWEDSCQLALSAVALLAKKYDKSPVRFMTVCARNRFESWREVLMCHWTNPQKEAHFYADYPETAVLEGVFTKNRPKLIVMDKEGKYVEEFSPFETEKIEKWLKK
jgi:thiol-disulfide isomerase/thioredoxin